QLLTPLGLVRSASSPCWLLGNRPVSMKNASSALMKFSIWALATDALAGLIRLYKVGPTNAAKSPIITSTISSSIIVKPLFFRINYISPYTVSGILSPHLLHDHANILRIPTYHGLPPSRINKD